MKLPKQTKRYCPYCKKHVEHKITQAKKKTPGSAHPLSKGSKKRTGAEKGMGSRGRFSRKAINKWKMTGAKTSKKVDLRYECKDCKKQHLKIMSRAKKVEMK